MDSLHIWFLFLWFSYTQGLQKCDTPQFVDFGKTQMIQCDFGEDVHLVSWYNSTNPNSPLIQLDGSVKKGNEAAEYDILPNGSLIIRNVSLKHDHSFIVLCENGDYTQLEVLIVVTVTPAQVHPIIDECEDPRYCYMQLKENSEITCRINGARPAANLTWTRRTSDGDQPINFEQSSYGQVNTALFTSYANITSDLFANYPLLVLLVCRATNPPFDSTLEESTILLQTRDTVTSSQDAVAISGEINTELELPCADRENDTVVWKRRDTDVSNVIVHSSFGEKVIYVDGFDVTTEGSLIIQLLTIQHEGSYICMSSDGLSSDHITLYEVSVYVQPDPPYLVVDGCNQNEYCVLEAEREGNLTCSVKGIRPQVQLEWLAFDDTTSKMISFFEERRTVVDKGDTFDVTLTAFYRVQEGSESKLTVKCSTIGAPVQQRTKYIDLLFPKEHTKEITTDDAVNHDNIILIMVPLLLVLFAITWSVMFLIYFKRKTYKWDNEHGKRNYEMRTPAQLEEQVKLIPQMDDFKQFANKELLPQMKSLQDDFKQFANQEANKKAGSAPASYSPPANMSDHEGSSEGYTSNGSSGEISLRDQ